MDVLLRACDITYWKDNAIERARDFEMKLIDGVDVPQRPYLVPLNAMLAISQPLKINYWSRREEQILVKYVQTWKEGGFRTLNDMAEAAAANEALKRTPIAIVRYYTERMAQTHVPGSESKDELNQDATCDTHNGRVYRKRTSTLRELNPKPTPQAKLHTTFLTQAEILQTKSLLPKQPKLLRNITDVYEAMHEQMPSQTMKAFTYFFEIPTSALLVAPGLYSDVRQFLDNAQCHIKHALEECGSNSDNVYLFRAQDDGARYAWAPTKNRVLWDEMLHGVIQLAVEWKGRGANELDWEKKGPNATRGPRAISRRVESRLKGFIRAKGRAKALIINQISKKIQHAGEAESYKKFPELLTIGYTETSHQYVSRGFFQPQIRHELVKHVWAMRKIHGQREEELELKELLQFTFNVKVQAAKDEKEPSADDKVLTSTTTKKRQAGDLSSDEEILKASKSQRVSRSSTNGTLSKGKGKAKSAGEKKSNGGKTINQRNTASNKKTTKTTRSRS